jgi:hypothetical protein
MTLHQTHLVAFAAGSVIHGVQSFLVWRLMRETTGANKTEAKEGLAICVLAMLWQFGNFWREMAITYGADDGNLLLEAGVATQTLALYGFPVLFSYMIPECRSRSRAARALAAIGRGLRAPMWLFAGAAAAAMILIYAGVALPFDRDWPVQMTLNFMLFYFLAFFVLGITNARANREMESRPAQRANTAAVVASALAVATFFFMLWSPSRIGRGEWMQLAAQMTSVPFTIAMAYRLYQFPFMDAFLREVLTGVTLLVTFCVAFTAGPLAPPIRPLFMAAVCLGLAYAKAPLSRWVDRGLLGYSEAVEDQEERIGNAVRALSRLTEFGARISEILREELEADWVSLSAERKADAVAEFRIAGSSPLWLSFGPRRGARTYMSRHLRVARRASLELATQHERLQREDAERHQLELREITARAQMRALQAQINPHFLFNTLNVLANLIHSNPAKAEHLTEDLAEIFRYALESTRQDRVRLEDEMRFIEAYLEIEKARFEDRLTYALDVDPGLRSLRIPPMILQPLVENAIKHGISPKIEGGDVRLTVRADSQRITICVEDTGAGLRHKGKPGSGIGLPNVRERLSHVYGEAAVLRLEEVSPSGTRAVLEVPA